jgi:glycosyltransferase involved in cell wall biosynthesis
LPLDEHGARRVKADGSGLGAAAATASAGEERAFPQIHVPTAIVHDWFQGFHGSERVVEAMLSGIFAPGNRPDIFTFHAARELLPQPLSAAIVRESRLSRLPGVRQRGHDPGRWRYLLPYMPYYFRRLPLARYDLVISSSHAFAVAVSPRADALHVCYCNTPLRYAWLPETERGRARGLKGLALRAVADPLRRLDARASARPDGFVANSTAVRDRIRTFYGRDAVVIHPPVDLDDFSPSGPKEPGRFLWVHRLVAYKRPELVVEAFRNLPYRLTMVGIGPLERRLRADLPPNVELRGWVGRDELARLYAEASGFIHIGEEDFGITMVEALASGTPVIALGRGGACDIVRDGVDGILLPQAEVEPLQDAVRRAAEIRWDPDGLATHARQFSRDAFLRRFASYLAKLEHRGAT